MGRNIVEKILYRRRRFVTRQRIRTVAEVISQLLPVVATGKPSATRIAGALDAIAHHADNDSSSQAVEANTPGLRRRIKELKRQLHDSPNTADAKRLQQKLDVLYDLLVEESENLHE